MITVFGATGKTGQHVAAGLVERGVGVRALVRDAEKAKNLLPPSVELIVGDLASEGDVRRALDGADKIYLAVGDTPDQQQLEINVVDEAEAAGVAHIVKTSMLGANPDATMTFARWHAAVEQHIAGTGILTTMLRPNWFHQNFLESAVTISREGALYGAAGDARLAFIDARDIAAVAVIALTEEGHEGAEYYLTGPESLTYKEAAERLAAGIGRTVKYVQLDDADYRAGLLAAGVPQWLADGLVELEQGNRAGLWTDVSPNVETLLVLQLHLRGGSAGDVVVAAGTGLVASSPM